MKKTFIFLIFLFTQQIFAAECMPPHWFAAMKNPKLQLLVHEKGIGNSSDWSCELSGLKMDSVVRLQNLNYIMLYLDLSSLKEAVEFRFHYKIGRKKHVLPYQLKAQPDKVGTRLEEHDVMYLLMPDRFSNGDPSNDYPKGFLEKRNSRDSSYGRHGGDLKGVTQHLDYLEKMGITTLWLNPIYENNEPLESYHGYAITDHYKIDARLGTPNDYRALIDAMHKKEMRMVKDMVFNHIGDQHLLYQDLIDSSWFHFWPKYTRTNFRAPILMDPYAAPSEHKKFNEGWFDHHMPDLNCDNIHLQTYLIQQTLWWLAEYQIDALRIDTYAYPGMAFMSKWETAVSIQYPEVFIFGEIWDHGAGVQSWFGEELNTIQSGLPALTDFTFCWALHHAFNDRPGWNTGLAEVYYTLAQDYMIARPDKMVTFIDNHDLPRAFGVYGKDTSKFIGALSVLMTSRGIPCIYYGTEQLMASTGNDDEKRPEWRGGWPGDKAPEFYQDSATFTVIQTLAQMRQNSDVFEPDARIIQFVPNGGKYVYMRELDGHGIAVLVSTEKERTEFRLSDYPELYEAMGQSEAKLTFYHVPTNRDAVFGLEQNEVVIIEW